MKLVLALPLLLLLLVAAPAHAQSGPSPCFGAASHDPEVPCVDPALAKTVTPDPNSRGLLADAPCRALRGADHMKGLEPCEFGATGAQAKETVALLGDSHAGSWRGAVAHVALARGWRGISLMTLGCPFTRAQIPAGGFARKRCNDARRARAAYLRSRPEISTVFVAARMDSSVARKRGQSPAAARAAGFRAAWRSDLPASVKRIIVLRDAPRSKGTMRGCIAQAVKAGLDAGAECTTPRRWALPRDGQVDAAKHEPRAEVVDLTDIMCDAATCPGVIGGVMVLSDGQHLTREFSESLGPILNRRLKP